MKEVSIISKVVSRVNNNATTTKGGTLNVDMSEYLPKSIWERVFKFVADAAGNEHLYINMPFDTKYGISMYADDGSLDLPNIYDGLPIDWQTIYWEEVKDADGNVTGRVLKAAGGGGEGGTVNGITMEQLSAYLSTNKYATQPWVESKGYLTGITLALITGALGFTPMDAASFTKANIKSKLSIADWALGANKPSYTFAEILNKPDTLAGYGITDALKKTNSDYYGIDFNSTLEDGKVRIMLRNGGNTRAGIGYATSGTYLTNYVTGKELWIADKLSFNGEGVFESLYVGGKTVAKGGLEVTGAAYFGGGTTYYFGYTGNVKCGKLDTTGAATIASTFTASANAFFGGELKGISPEGATYTPWRIILNEAALYIQAATKDGTDNRGKIYLTGMNAVKLSMLKLSSEETEVLGKLSVEGVLTSKVADGTAPMVITSTTKVANLNADMVDDFSVTTNGMLYRSIKSASDTSGEIWYLKVKFDRGWNSGLQHIEVSADYNNTNGKVLLELDSYNQEFGYRAKVSMYNNCNCTGFCYTNSASEGIGYLYLRFVGYSAAYAQIKSTIGIDSVTKIGATEAASVAWKNLSPKTIRANYVPIFDTDMIFGGNLKSLYNNVEYITLQNHYNGNISVSAASGDLYLGYVNTKSVICSTSLLPISNNVSTLGTSAKQWSSVYGVLGNFTGQVSAKSLSLNGGVITYDSTNKVFEIQGDVVVKGGVSMYSSLSGFTPSTIMDGVVVDGTTIKKDVNGRLSVVSGIGGINENDLASYLLGNNYVNSIKSTGSGNAITGVSHSGSGLTFTKGSTFALASTLDNYQTKITSSNKLAYSLISGTPTTLKNPTSLKFGSKTYDGSSEVTITASDLGALTSHQAIYNLTMQAGAFTEKTFDPNGAAQTVNIPTTTAHISESGNLYFTTARALAAITGAASSIKDANLTASRALISNSDGKVAVSAVTSTELGYLDGVTSAIQTQINGKAAKATTLSGYGITDGVTTNTAQTITGSKTFEVTSKIKSGFGINDENETGFLAIRPTTWTGLPKDGTAVGVGTTNTTLYLRSNKEAYLYRSDKAAAYKIIDASGGTMSGALYFGGNTTYYLGSTGNINCNALTANGATTLKSTLNVTGTSSFTGAASYNGGLNILNGSTLLISSGKVVYANQQVMYGTNTEGTYETCLYPRWADATYLNYGSKGFNIRNNSSVLTMHMTNDNKVGIGNNSPAYTLDVNGSIGGKSVNIYGSETTNKDKALFFCASDKSVRARIYYTGNTTDGLLNIESLYSNIAITTNSGKYVGIGTTTPSCKLHVAGDILSTGGITMYSDKRKKTILNEVELTLTQIADAPLVEHYYNSDAKKTTHVGSIAQYWAGLNDWFCKLDNEGFYTMEIQNAALASAISIARELQRYESKTDKKIRLLKERIGELEEEIEKLKTA